MSGLFIFYICCSTKLKKMFHSENQITIVQVANVWAVSMPIIPQEAREIKMAKAVIKSAVREQNKDALLEQLNPDLYKEDFNPEPFLERRLQNIHLFKTWKEVVKFISSIDEKTI